MEIDLRDLIRISRQRGWIVLFAVVIAGGAAFGLSWLQNEQFSATARVVVLAGQGPIIPGSEYNTLLASQGLAETYRLLIETGPVLDRVIDVLDLPYDFVDLDEKVTTGVIGQTQVIGVTVTDTDPVLAARIATSIVEEFPLYVQDQLDERIAAQIAVADPARVPTEPFAPRIQLLTMLGVLLGLVLGTALVALLEFMDNTVKPEQNLQGLTGAPVLASVSALRKLQPGGPQVFTLSQPRSSAAEAMRLLRTNLEFASATGEIHALTVTSPGPGEGKSTITANMGVVLAQSGLSVVIVDADLRKPTQHQVFAVSNARGLTTLLTKPDESWRTAAVKVALPGLLLVPSGPIPPNPADLVSGGRFAAMIDRIKADVDVVIIDSPPILSASDALSIAMHTDGVVLVCRSHKTRTDALRHAALSVHQGGIRLVGVVVNRQRGQHGASYYGQYSGTTATQGD